jgi:hypothetical protein
VGPLLKNDLFRTGIRLYSRNEFFEAHEVLEDLWRSSKSPERLFLQALIHFAVGFYHVQRGNLIGAERQLRKGLRKLAGYLPQYQGLDTARLFDQGQVCLREMADGERPAITPQIVRIDTQSIVV